MLELALVLLLKGLGTIAFAMLLAVGFDLGNRMMAKVLPISA